MRRPRRSRTSAHRASTDLSEFQMETFQMYDMYPEWGPARHSEENEAALASVQAGLDLRDNGGQRPDDN